MSGVVSRWSASGVERARWRVPEHERGTPSGLAIDGGGRVFIADAHYSRVIVFDLEGRELGRFGRSGTGPGEFLFPTDVVIDEQGYVYISEYGGNDRISRFTPQWEWESSFGGPSSASPLRNPSGLAFDAAGTLWVADTGNHRLCRFSTTGRMIETLGGLGGEIGSFRYPSDVAVDAAVGLFVCDRENNRVQWFRTDGTVWVWGEAGRGAGSLALPTSLAIARGADRLVLSDTRNDRVLSIRLEASARWTALAWASR
jgi:DNA-binding beta-propeller fold protein YncE